MSANSPPSDETKPTTKITSICQVCGDEASIINYGALTCLSCRTFFRRNGFNIKAVSRCRYGYKCELTKLSRKHCAACRLAKCLAVGMSSDLIRKEDLTSPKRKEDLTGLKRKFTTSHEEKFVENKTIMTIPQANALDFPADDCLRSNLNSSDWTIISNVIHAFERFNPVPEIRRTIETITTSASSFQFDLNRTLQMISSFSNCLQLFISSVPDFKILTTSEQWSLLQRNMFGLLSIGGIYLMRESGIFDKPENEMAVVPLYGNEVVQQAKLLSRQLDCDPTLLKLMLIAIAFSSTCFTNDNRGDTTKDSLLLGTFRLFGSQNVYVELLWKYLNHQYDYYEAAQQFSKLMKRLLDTIKFSAEIYENNQIYQRFIDSLLEEAEKSTVINDKTIIPLWGKG
ncbi:unnamed protein product [Adineta steineri]|uniref:Nuclear receptor domain-containing protein n=1 Tax=Adineta steineri TaxID=433720 RepID=A0A816AIT9_9BILA|nr:unnamed protein product [Adineta steineri]CAF1595513.1 unnamed protein product [Adineta steineri]